MDHTMPSFGVRLVGWTIYGKESQVSVERGEHGSWEVLPVKYLQEQLRYEIYPS